MSESKWREFHLLTTEIGEYIGPLATLFASAEQAEEAANMIKRSNSPVVLHVIEMKEHQRVLGLLDECEKVLLIAWGQLEAGCKEAEQVDQMIEKIREARK